MDTVGSLLDKSCILEIRMDHTEDQKKLDELKEQYGWMIAEIANVISRSMAGTRPLTFRKNKQYDKLIKVENIGLIDSIAALKKENQILWDLEDLRRDKTKTDEERLTAADKVSIHNKLRNEYIDKIDSYIQKYIFVILGNDCCEIH